MKIDQPWYKPQMSFQSTIMDIKLRITRVDVNLLWTHVFYLLVSIVYCYRSVEGL